MTGVQTCALPISLICEHSIPGSYAIMFFTASDFTFITRYNHNWVSFPLWLSVFISLLFPSSISDIYCSGGFIFQCHFFLPFHHVHGVLKARILKLLAIAFSSGPRFVRPCLAGACPLASQRSWMTCSMPWLSHCWLSLSA